MLLNEVQGQTDGVHILRRVVEGAWTSPLLLVGTEGVGRRFSIHAAAREAFSKGDPNSFQIVRLDKGAHPDFIVVASIERKAIGIEQIRTVLDQVSFLPLSADRRYVIIDGVDDMTVPAANALLKTLEEPHQSTQFFLLTESLRAVLPTIQSRCAIVKYRGLNEEFIVSRLRQHTDDGDKALVVARLSEGSVGRAIQYLGSGRVALRDSMVSLLEKSLTGDFASLFSAVSTIAGTSAKTSLLPLGLRFLHHILYDLTMAPYSETRLTNVDIVGQIHSLRARIGLDRLGRLVTGLRAISDLGPSVNLGAHVKTYLASTFSE